MPHKQYEIIVIDDGSLDQTAFCLELFSCPNDSVLKIIKNKSNIGLPASINKGIDTALGKYIIRVDSDDFVNTHFLEFLKIFLDTNPHIDSVASDYYLVDECENILERKNALKSPIACGILFKKDHLIEIGLYDEKFKWQEEVELMMRFTEKYKIGRLEIPLYRYRKHKDNMTNNKEEMQKYQDLIIKKHIKYKLNPKDDQ